MRGSAWWSLLARLGLAACHGRDIRKTEAEGPSTALAEARAFLSSGKPDDALAALSDRNDPEALTVQGRAWMLKARQAEASGVEGATQVGALVAPLVLGPQASRSLALLDKAVATQPDLADAHLAIAELLEPGAVRWLAAQSQTRSPKANDRSHAKPPPAFEGDSVLGPDRVLQEYRRAAHADRASVSIIESWLRFSLTVGRPEESEVALQELVARRPRETEPLVRYGDFLRDVRGDATGALERYGQALIWFPEDEAIKSRVAGVYLDLAEQCLRSREYSAAEQRLRDASRSVVDSTSPVGQRLLVLRQKLAEVRQR